MPTIRFRILLARIRVARALKRDESGVLPLRIAALLILVVVPLMGSCLKASPVAVPLVVEPLHPDDGVVDIRQDGGVPVRRGIPPKPADWQKVPPCDPDAGEVPINGACYIELRMRPPCGKTLEHGQGCFRPVTKVQREPSSMERR